MFDFSETGPCIENGRVQFRIYLPGIDQQRDFGVKAYVIDKREQFDARIPATECVLNPDEPAAGSADPTWGQVAKTLWKSDFRAFDPGTYLYRFEITGPSLGDGSLVQSLYFGDPCARETDTGTFSVFRMPAETPWKWNDGSFQVPRLEEIILYELNVAEFGGSFAGVADRIPYLLSLGINAIELMPVNSIAEPSRWGYMPVFYFAPEERFGGPRGLRDLVQACHASGIAVVLDMVYAHTDRMFPYQIGYERFFHFWEDDRYTDTSGIHHAPNPIVSAYDNFGRKNDWRMASTRQFFTAVNAFWMSEYHIDGFRLDHVNGYLDHGPVKHDGGINWYSHENRPTFTALQELTKATYAASRSHPRFMPETGGPSRIIQIAEDLGESPYQLSQVSDSAVNGNWEKELAGVVKEMAANDTFSSNLGRALLQSDSRFSTQGYTGAKTVDGDTIPALVVQYIESHDENRLFYLMQRGGEEPVRGYEYRNGLDDQPWWRLQPYAIALLTCVGMPMVWAGQEFAENTGLADRGLVRVRGLRPLHWDYFYNVAAVRDRATVLPLVTLYRHLGRLRRSHPALRSPRENAREEYCDPEERLLVYRRWLGGEVMIVALNFSQTDKSVPIPFGHSGTWVDRLDAKYNNASPFSITITDAASHVWVPIPGNFGRLFRLE